MLCTTCASSKVYGRKRCRDGILHFAFSLSVLKCSLLQIIFQRGGIPVEKLMMKSELAVNRGDVVSSVLQKQNSCLDAAKILVSPIVSIRRSSTKRAILSLIEFRIDHGHHCAHICPFSLTVASPLLQTGDTCCAELISFFSVVP